MIADVALHFVAVVWSVGTTVLGVIAMVIILVIHGHISPPVLLVLRKDISIGEGIALSVNGGMTFTCRMDR